MEGKIKEKKKKKTQQKCSCRHSWVLWRCLVKARALEDRREGASCSWEVLAERVWEPSSHITHLRAQGWSRPSWPLRAVRSLGRDHVPAIRCSHECYKILECSDETCESLEGTLSRRDVWEKKKVSSVFGCEKMGSQFFTPASAPDSDPTSVT